MRRKYSCDIVFFFRARYGMCRVCLFGVWGGGRGRAYSPAFRTQFFFLAGVSMPLAALFLIPSTLSPGGSIFWCGQIDTQMFPLGRRFCFSPGRCMCVQHFDPHRCGRLRVLYTSMVDLVWCSRRCGGKATRKSKLSGIARYGILVADAPDPRNSIGAVVSAQSTALGTQYFHMVWVCILTLSLSLCPPGVIIRGQCAGYHFFLFLLDPIIFVFFASNSNIDHFFVFFAINIDNFFFRHVLLSYLFFFAINTYHLLFSSLLTPIIFFFCFLPYYD